MSTEVSLKQINRRESFNPYIWSDPKEEIAIFQSQENHYNRLAIITQVAVACIISSSLIACAIYAPYLIPALLLCSYKILYEPLHSHFLTPLYEKAEEAKENRAVAQGIVNKIIEIKQDCSSYWDYKNYFTKSGIEPAFIQNKDKLTSIDSTRICYRALVHPLARVSYWSDRSKELVKELTLLQKEKEEMGKLCVGALFASNEPEKRKLAKSFEETDRKMHKLVQEEFLPAKIKAAFNLHLLANPADQRKFEEFGYLSLIPYQDCLNLPNSHEEQPYFYIHQTPEAPLTMEWLMRATIPQIAKKIYRDLAIIV